MKNSNISTTQQDIIDTDDNIDMHSSTYTSNHGVSSCNQLPQAGQELRSRPSRI